LVIWSHSYKRFFISWFFTHHNSHFSSDSSNKGNNDESHRTSLKNTETAGKLMEQYHSNEEVPQKRVLVPISNPNDFEIFDVPFRAFFIVGAKSSPTSQIEFNPRI
jgi:hypothetical protein